jgi:hypothetical protein
MSLKYRDVDEKQRSEKFFTVHLSQDKRTRILTGVGMNARTNERGMKMAIPFTAEQLVAQELARSNAWEQTTYHGPYLIADLRKVFDRLHQPNDWKGPILAHIPHETFAICKAAVAYFAGSELKVDGVLIGSEPPGMLQVRANGYRADVGA